MKKKIVGWAVVYMPTQKGRIFAGLKPETVEAFECQLMATIYCNSLNQGGYLDDLHIGYRVYPMNWIPKGVQLKMKITV
jgi:hypothetical protein